MNLSGYWFLDGADMWINYGLVIRKGTADFLKLAARKQSIEHDWYDQNGVDVDTTKIFLQRKQGTLQCMICTESESEFFLKYQALKNKLTQSGLRRFTIRAHGNKSYYILYEEMTSYIQIKALHGINDKPVVHEFNLTISEPNPDESSIGDAFIAADNGEFLII